MTHETIKEMVELPDELLGTPFERIVILAFKEICNNLRDHEDRIQALEKGEK